MSDFLNTFAARLKPSLDTADGEDWRLAERTLPEDITKPIPACIFRTGPIRNPDYDEAVHGKLKPDDPNKPDKMIEAPIAVMEAVNVLAWVMVHKVNPVITLEEVARGITRENRRDTINDIWKFWIGTPLYSDGEEEEEADESSVNPPDKKPPPRRAKNSGKA